MRVLSLLVICSLPLAVLADSKVEPYRAPEMVPDTGIGMHYDGSGVVPGQEPPTSFDQKTGRNIRWKVPLPQWGMAGLVPVGNRVLHLADADARFIWPVLRCYDSATGTLVWKHELNPLDAIPGLSAEDRKDATATVQRLWDDNRAAFRAMRPVVAGKADLAQANKELAARGIKVKRYSRGYGSLRYVEYPREYEDLKEKLLKNYNIQPNLSNQGIARTGDAFGTPVSDGQYVYVTTIHGHVTAVRMEDGRVAWTRSLVGLQAPRYKEANHFMTSPRLYKDMLLAFWGDTNMGRPDILVAMDKRTGKERWHLEVNGWDNTLNGQWKADRKQAFWGRPGASPRVLDLNGEPVALLGNGQFVRLRDGKPYEGGVLPNVQNYIIDDTTNTIYGSVSLDGPGSHFGARVALEDGELKFESLFFWPNAGFGSNWGSHGFFHKGRLYWADCLVDPNTGIPVNISEKYMPETSSDRGSFIRGWRDMKKRWQHKAAGTMGFGRMFTVLANDHIYGMAIDGDGKKNGYRYGVLCVTTLDGKRVAACEIRQNEQTPEHLLDQGWPAKDPWSYTAPMAIGNNCIYTASDQFLYCIGR